MNATLYTRKQHMDEYSGLGDAERFAAHQRYYAQFVTAETIASVVYRIGADGLKASTDRSFNDIPLRDWDVLQFGMPFDRQRVKDAGDFVSLSTVVCVAKEAARMWLSAEEL